MILVLNTKCIKYRIAGFTLQFIWGFFMSKGMLFVVSAPSGAGKTTLISRIRKLFPDLLYSISCTTRYPRSGEKNGEHYYFVSIDEFMDMIKDDLFLEWKHVHGNYYGTPALPVKEAILKSKQIMLDIDVQGAKEVFKKVPESVGIFITVLDFTILEKRLRARGSDTEAVIQTRLKNAVIEMTEAGLFKYKIVNEDLNKAVEEFAAIITLYRNDRVDLKLP